MPQHSTHRVRIGDLVPADSPRLNGVDQAHVRRLSAVYASLPPVLVHRSTLRVVDGMHRIGAAVLLDLDTVEVQYFDGPEDQVFLRTVTVNIAHGLPLSVAERKAAAGRILASRPHMSDRAVAACTGLDAKTVASVRVRSAAGSPPLNTRTGTDGKTHPLDRTAERIHAAELMTRDPDLSLRAVVRKTGLSLGTAHDVRRRLLRGEDPVPPSRQSGPPPGAAPVAKDGPRDGSGTPVAPAAPAPGGRPVSPRARSPLDTLRRLANDPSLRQSDAGRDFIRWLHIHFVVDEAWHKRADAVPPHATESIAEIARHCSDTWRRFAEDMSRRKHAGVPRGTDLHATQPTRR
ncbi:MULTISPECIES: transcriptional regulator [unclassified Streptomyces]|uniref:transcriptional regulator n=1 Tax=unclassified Streptomyces TaxID=2593676 RepID=UPI0009673929|nr:transcriptional regulator [Streptomyces sp. CB02058]OKI86507.1 transcriptional regulator [Streptomyces sp. CB02058]